MLFAGIGVAGDGRVVQRSLKEPKGSETDRVSKGVSLCFFLFGIAKRSSNHILQGALQTHSHTCPTLPPRRRRAPAGSGASHPPARSAS